MARKISSRTVLNRKALTAIRAGFVDGMEEMGRTFIERTDVPDDPATSERIVGDYGVWVDGRKVAGSARKPRGASVKRGITLIAGFPFPMRFYNLGTIHQPARPVEIRAMNETIPGAEDFIRPKVRAKLAGVK